MRAIPFLAAVLAGSLAFVALDPAAANKHDQARYAATFPGLQMKRELSAILDEGFDVNTRYSSPAGWTLLHFAAAEGYADNVRFLLERGADPALEDERFRKAIDVTYSEEVKAILRQASATASGGNRSSEGGSASSVSVMSTAAPASSDPQPGAAAPPSVPSSGSTGWDAFGRFGVGDQVLYAQQGGKSWARGTIKQVGGAPGIVPNKYLVTSEDGYNDWWDADQVTSVERQPYWTGFFVGDWRLSVPLSRVTRVSGGDVYRVYSGGVRLPSLRINADGTYSWVTTKYGGGEEVVNGRWDPSPNGPGVILRRGERGDDWLVYTTTTSQGRQSHGTEQIYIGSDNHPAKQGFRLR